GELENDIMAASDYTANPEAVSSLVHEGQNAVQELLLDELGVNFDRDDGGALKLTREGGHRERRIIFAKDTTGRAILNRMHEHVRALEGLILLENHVAIDLLTLSHNSVHAVDKYKPITCIGAYL